LAQLSEHVTIGMPSNKISMTIAGLRSRVGELLERHTGHDVDIFVRPLGGTERLKAECSISDGRRYVDFAFIDAASAKVEGAEECFTWIYGEYQHRNFEDNFDARRYGTLDDAVLFVERWIIEHARVDELPRFGI
jgi:hypothetical protein